MGGACGRRQSYLPSEHEGGGVRSAGKEERYNIGMQQNERVNGPGNYGSIKGTFDVRNDAFKVRSAWFWTPPQPSSAARVQLRQRWS